MEKLDSIVKSLIAIIAAATALWTGGLGGVIIKLVNDAKVRKAAKQISEDGHAKTQEMLKDTNARLDQQTAFYERVIAEKDAIIKKQDKELTELRKQFMDSLQERIKGA